MSTERVNRNGVAPRQVGGQRPTLNCGLSSISIGGTATLKWIDSGLQTILGALSGTGPTYHMTMEFGGTVLYVEAVSPVVDFYRRAFGLELRFFDETLGFAELETGGSMLAIAAHSLGEMLMPNMYLRPAEGRPAGVEIAFLTRDVPASFAKAIAEGATPLTPPRRMPWGLEVAYIRAPEGTLIGFSEPSPTTTK